MPDVFHHLRFFSAAASGAAVADRGAFRLLSAHAQMPPLPQDVLQFRDIHALRFAEGHTAVIGERGAAVAFIAWLAAGRLRIDELALTWRIPPKHAVVYDVYTTPEHRGQGVYTDALAWIRAKLAEENIVRCWIYAEQSNRASIRGISKAGFAYAGSVRSLRFGKRAFRVGRVAGSGL
jgi:GNAT superfamily N-acetyltransferase